MGGAAGRSCGGGASVAEHARVLPGPASVSGSRAAASTRTLSLSEEGRTT